MATETISETDLKNAALALVGEEPLSSLTDDSKAQMHTELLYPLARNECFDMRVNWAFCKARAEVGAYAVAPILGSYDYQFVLPSGCRRVRTLQESTDDDTEYEFRREVLVVTSGGREIEHDVILANVSTAYITYTRLRTDPNRWPAYFTHLVYIRLAILLCEPLKQDKQKKNQLLKMYENALFEAKAGNGAEDADTTDQDRNSDLGNNDVLDAAQDSDVEKRYIVNRPT